MDWWGDGMELEWTQEIVENEVMKYKELLDDGIITEEEFSVKEEELLFYLK